VFDNEALPHIEGSVDPVRDIETIDLELQVKDLESVEKKTDRLKKAVKLVIRMQSMVWKCWIVTGNILKIQ